MKNKTLKIGIGITTHNRREVFLKSLHKIEEMSKTMPVGARIVIVDDASDIACPEATYRFEQNVGIATAKNKCIELLEDCDHIFLFDDDCYPISPDWWQHYINAGEPHLMYIFKDFVEKVLNDCEEIYRDTKIVAYTQARGCMIYLSRRAIDLAGGMDQTYKRWGFEHADLSNRIYNLGLTTMRFADVIGSEKLIYSGDEHQIITTTVPREERLAIIEEMRSKYEKSLTSIAFIAYKPGAKRKESDDRAEDMIVTTYMNGHADVQRAQSYWDADYSKLSALCDSIVERERTLTILHNCFDNVKDNARIKHVKMQQTMNPYLQRWLWYWQFLRDNPGIKFAFLTDGTDVEMLSDPFPLKTGTLYVGDEEGGLLGCQWIRENTHTPELQKFVDAYPTQPILNCGIVGGDRDMLMAFCRDMYLGFIVMPAETIDMPLFNFVCRSKYRDVIEYGRHITTRFRANERTAAWFKHK